MSHMICRPHSIKDPGLFKVVSCAFFCHCFDLNKDYIYFRKQLKRPLAHMVYKLAQLKLYFQVKHFSQSEHGKWSGRDYVNFAASRIEIRGFETHDYSMTIRTP